MSSKQRLTTVQHQKGVRKSLDYLPQNPKTASSRFTLTTGKSGLGISKIASSITQKGKKGAKGKKKLKETKPEEVDLKKVNVKKVFLYLQLQKVTNLPERLPSFSIGLKHSSSMFDDIQPIGDEKLTFAIPIEQDSFKGVDLFSDQPMLITLYETYFSYDIENQPHELKTHLRPIAQGHIDLLPFFTKKRSISDFHSFLYPIEKTDIDVDVGTCQTFWHIYSLMPILINVAINNIIFVTFESIYNADEDIHQRANDIVVKVSFQSKFANNQNIFVKEKACEYTAFSEELIAFQDGYCRWASLFGTYPPNVKHLGQQSGFQLDTSDIFKDLLCTENVDFDFKSINPNENLALVSNCMRRFVLRQEECEKLQELVAFDEQELLLEVYYHDDPDEILLAGVVDLSIFMYPNVRACRFAVELKPVTVDEEADTRISGKKSIGPLSAKKIFAIINICLSVPLSEPHDSPLDLNDTILKSSNYVFESLASVSQKMPEKSYIQMCEENYNNFDKQVAVLVDAISTKNITTIDAAKAQLCCDIVNLNNNIMELIACDFNIKVQTNTSAEFTNLMTTVHKELMQRVEGSVKEYSENPLRRPSMTNSVQEKIISLLSTIKLLREVGDEDMASILMQKVDELNIRDNSIEFYKYLYDVEKRNFEEAKSYIARPLRQKFGAAEKFTELIEIYITYVEKMQNESFFNEALQYLLGALDAYNTNYPAARSCWILLHCLYKLHRYLPGMSYTRWKYENLPESETLSNLPRSLWHIYLKYNVKSSTRKQQLYITAAELFQSLGLYIFAEIVFENIAHERTDFDQYVIRKNFQIIYHDNSKTASDIRKFPTEKYINSAEMTLAQAQVNGNMYYIQGKRDAAMREYKIVVNAKSPDGLENFQLSVWRYAYFMLQTQKFDNACTAFKSSDPNGSNIIVTEYIMGKSMYYLDRLEEAESHFANCTNFDLHIPNVWGFLALVNMKLSRTLSALECWKYAKLNPNNVICDEILEELNKINTDEIPLAVN